MGFNQALFVMWNSTLHNYYLLNSKIKNLGFSHKYKKLYKYWSRFWEKSANFSGNFNHIVRMLSMVHFVVNTFTMKIYIMYWTSIIITTIIILTWGNHLPNCHKRFLPVWQKMFELAKAGLANILANSPVRFMCVAYALNCLGSSVKSIKECVPNRPVS